MNKGTLLVLSGSSGVGKSTIIAQVLEQRPELYFSVSCTTRAPRPGEVDGVNYTFISREEFQARIERGEFLEYAEYVGNYYGTSMTVIREKLEQGVDVLLDIEVQGAAKVRERLPDAASVFIVPPSFEELAQRLRVRTPFGAGGRTARRKSKSVWKPPAGRPRRSRITTTSWSTTRWTMRPRRS